MTKYKGMLLFDIAEEPINGWENQLGYRGMMEVWKKGKDEVVIELEDGTDEESWEVRIETPDNFDSIGFGNTEEEATKIAVEYMKTH